MNALHRRDINSARWSAVNGCTDGVWLLVPLDRTSLQLFSLCDLHAKPLDFHCGHSKTIECVAISNRDTRGTVLCTCSSDKMLVWYLDLVIAAINTHYISSMINGPSIRCVDQQPVCSNVITDLGEVHLIQISSNGSQIAACVENDVIVFGVKNSRLRITLDGHNNQVNCLEFTSGDENLITASDDRTFKIWNLKKSTLQYQSDIVSSSPFVSMCISKQSLVLGSSDGMLRIYDLTCGNGVRCLRKIDTQSLYRKYAVTSDNNDKQVSKSCETVSSRPKWRQEQKPESFQYSVQDGIYDDTHVQSTLSVLSIVVLDKSHAISSRQKGKQMANHDHDCDLFFNDNNSLTKELISSAKVLMVLTSHCMLSINFTTSEFISIVNFSSEIPSCINNGNTDKLIGYVTSGILCEMIQKPTCDNTLSNASQYGCWCIICGLFDVEVNILEVTNLDIKAITRTNVQNSTSTCGRNTFVNDSKVTDGYKDISVLSSTPLCPNSPLRSQLSLKARTSSPKKSSKNKNALSVKYKSSNDLTNQPLTFGNKIKSSGYSAISDRKMFTPKTKSKSKSDILSTIDWSSRSNEYPVDGNPPTKLVNKIDVDSKPTSINTIIFSHDGKHLACCCANSSTQIFKVPLNGKGFSYAGQKSTMQGCDWSRDSSLLLSYGDSGATLWDLSSPDPIMQIDRQYHNFPNDNNPEMDNGPFKKSLKGAQFYYLDKFILMSSGNQLKMYKYHLDNQKCDIKRYMCNNRYKLAKNFQLNSNITCFSAVNSFNSYLALCACSDKSIDIWDLNTCQSVSTYKDAHIKAAHCIVQNQGSNFVRQTFSNYDLFLTSAMGDCIKLWDLRSNTCAQRFEGHCNRSYPCAATFSPCSRYIASGSEDRSAYIFDIRTGTYLHKITGHTDTVTSVAFHPKYPQMITASVDGKVRVFS